MNIDYTDPQTYEPLLQPVAVRCEEPIYDCAHTATTFYAGRFCGVVYYLCARCRPLYEQIERSFAHYFAAELEDAR